MKIKSNPKAGDGGFSLVQLLTVFAIGGILSGLLTAVYPNFHSEISEEALRNDVRTINRAIGVYQAFGGSLEGVTSPAAVIAKLQTVADELTFEQTAGLTGSMLDRRLRPVLLSENEAKTEMLRAIWNAGEKRFEIATTGENGVLRFKLDESLAGEGVTEEAREQNLKLASTNGWIWEYGDHGASHSSGPTQILSVYAVGSSVGAGPGSGAGSGFGSGGGEGSGEGSDDEAGDTAQLNPPLFSIPSGHYPVTDYNLRLELSNPNMSGVSRILYKVNSGPWSVYFGTPIYVTPYATVTAYTESVVPDSWSNSEQASEYYCVNHVKLDPPVIVVSEDGTTEIKNPNNGHGNNEDGVDVSNPGQGGGGPNGEVDLSGEVDDEIKPNGKVKFKVNGNDWQEYNGQFVVAGEENHIVACVIATELYYEDSDLASLSVESNSDHYDHD